MNLLKCLTLELSLDTIFKSFNETRLHVEEPPLLELIINSLKVTWRRWKEASKNKDFHGLENEWHRHPA